MKTLSIIIPTYNERESISELYVALKKELNRLDVASEIIFVDDGSADGTGRILRDLQKNDASITIVDFRRNFGKAAALSAGFQMARGDVIVTMDADLQDQPAELHRLLDKLESGYDLVSGWKKVRHDPIGKRWPSRVFNAVTALLTGVPLHDMNCGFKAYRRQVVEEIALYGEMHRYIPVLASYRGFRVGEVVVEHRHRPYGRSKYGITRLFSGFFDLLTVIMLTRYNRKPLHAFV
ncbi:MAG: glycosyltransferase family 2 protein, partial [Acidobacteriota bacterium]